VTFTFAAALPVYSPGDNATPANPDIATLTNISGQTAQVDATSLGDTLFINQYYYKTDRWFLNYINAGATVTMTWHVVGKDGQPLANTAVSLLANLNFSDTYCGVTWGGSVQTLNSCSHTNGSGQGVLASGTDANGDVTFTLTNNNTAPNLPPPSDTTSAAAGNTYEYNEDKGRAGGYPYCDMVLQVGSDVFSANPNATVNQGTDRVDFILIP
jgi:hypothetical protein